MPLEEKLHTVTHLKALISTCEQNILLKIGKVALLHSSIPTWKVPILLHKQAKWGFIVKVAVYVIQNSEEDFSQIFCKSIKTRTGSRKFCSTEWNIMTFCQIENYLLLRIFLTFFQNMYPLVLDSILILQ